MNKLEAAPDLVDPPQLGTDDDNIHVEKVNSGSSPTAEQLEEAPHAVWAELGVNPDGRYDGLEAWTLQKSTR